MGFLSFLKPAPHIEEERNPEVVQKKYRYWRWRIFYSMYIGYAFYYITRGAFKFAMPSLILEYGFTKGDLGILLSIGSITYGLSKFISGVMSDRANPRYFMAFGLIITGLFNIFLGMSSTLFMLAIFWGLNQWFQGWGWPPSARLLTHWYSQKERGTWWGFWNSAHSVGGFLIPIIAAACAQFLGWQWAVYIPGILGISAGLFLLNRLRDTPRSLGLPTVEKFRNDYATASHEEDKDLNLKQILFDYVLKNKYIWMLGISYFFVYIIRQAINDWSMIYFIETKSYSQVAAGFSVSFFEIGGIFGSLTAGWASDKIFKGRRGPINALFAFGVIFAISMMWLNPLAVMALDSIFMFTIGFLIFGPQMLIGIAAAELSHKKAAGTATGFVGWIAYLGAATAGYPLGLITQKWGWEGFFMFIAACGVISVACLLPLWNVKSFVSKKSSTPPPDDQIDALEAQKKGSTISSKDKNKAKT